MNDDQIDDLKQFIEATVSQTEERLTKRIEGVEDRLEGVEERLDHIEQKVDDGFAGVGEAIDVLSTQTDERLTNLEQQAA